MDKFAEATPSGPGDDSQNPKQQDVVPQKPGLMGALIESGHLIDGLKWPVFKRVLIFLFLAVLTPLVIAVSMTFVMTSQLELFIHHNPWIISGTIRTIILFLAIIIWMQMIMFGVKRATGMPLYLEIINADCLRMKWDLLQLAILLILLNSLVSYLTPLPSVEFFTLKEALKSVGLYLLYWIATIPIYLFAIPDVIMRQQTANTALKNAYTHGALYWKKIAASFGVLYLALISLGAFFIIFSSYYNKRVTLIAFEIILLILSIWIIPLFVALSGVLFRDAYLSRKNPS